MRHRTYRGFTLIELMIAVAIVAILVRVALPSYTSYIKRSKVPPGLDALAAYAVRMEQYYQDNSNYGVGGACGVTAPAGVDNFTITCTLTSATQYSATATGSGTLSGYTYTVDNSGTRKTTAHPNGVPAGNCWSIKGRTCDA